MPGVIVYRFSAPLIFSNATAFTNTGEGILIDAAAKGPLPHTLVIDFEEVFLVDDTGAAAITSLFHYAQRYGVDLALARVHSGTHKLLELSGVTGEIGEHRIYDTVRNAVDAVSAAGSVATPDAEARGRGLTTDNNYHGQDLRGRSFRGANLDGADFTDADVRAADFAKASLVDADFTNARIGVKPLTGVLILVAAMLVSIAAGVVVGLLADGMEQRITSASGKTSWAASSCWRSSCCSSTC